MRKLQDDWRVKQYIKGLERTIGIYDDVIAEGRNEFYSARYAVKQALESAKLWLTDVDEQAEK